MTDDTQLWPTWFRAAADPAVDAELRDLFDRLDAAVRAKGPTCWTSGKCCNFDAYGHRLYVTGLEIAWVVRGLGSGVSGLGEATKTLSGATLPILSSHRPQTLDPRPLEPSCQYQRDRLCTIHANRPMGCRVFFCQEGTQAWQQELYERFLAELRRMHEKRGLPYRYMEWRAGLREAEGYLAETTAR